LEDGTRVRSYRGYSFGNLFHINKTGKFEMTLEFEEQRLFDIGKYVLLGSLIILTMIILIPTRRLEGLMRQVKKNRPS